MKNDFIKQIWYKIAAKIFKNIDPIFSSEKRNTISNFTTTLFSVASLS